MATQYTLDRDVRLAEINSALSARHLRQQHWLGDRSKGEIEILAIKAIHDFAGRFFTYVTYAVAFPGTGEIKEGEFSVRYNANGEVCDGAVMVVLINGRFAILRQWRLPLGRWTYETPRGFSEKLDRAYRADETAGLGLTDLGIGTMLRELDEEVMKNAKLKGVIHLGNVAENSGTNAVSPSYFLVEIEVPEGTEIGGSDENTKLFLWDAEKVADEIGGKINDCHTITAFSLARKRLSQLGRL